MSILIKPIITEKANNDSELNNRYTFQVEKTANKVEIKKVIESTYGVKVVKVRTINVRSDRRVRYTKAGIQLGKSNAIKKAIIQLEEGESIDLYSNV
mgnify:CR=1 FL=1|tara:strand:+ start:328 stop:618 length:291 start_codon:yes stop_codon:yes gene_type:complete